MDRGHVVWDWNGTLLDDLPIVVESVNRSIALLGEAPITDDEYRDHYTRPVRLFYQSMFGRELSDREWSRLNEAFHEHYFLLAADAGLRPGAREAMQKVTDCGFGQSLLSMSPQSWLAQIVERLEIEPHFQLVTGLSGPTGGLKAPHLVAHLRRLRLKGSVVVMIGDTPDDVVAARHVGARPVLFHGGSHHLHVLEALDAPIAETLVEAAEIACSDVSRR